MNRISAWFLSDAGKKFSYFAAATATSGVLLANVLPHTLLLDKYKDFMHLYKHGFSVTLTPKLQERFQKALDLLQVDDRDRPLFKPFAVYGFDVFSAGSSYSKYGVYVGLPANFFYEDVDQVDRQSIKLRDDSVMWDLEEGKLLQKSLVLSENAQLYAMAREIRLRETYKQIIDAVLGVTACTGFYGLSNTCNNKWNLYVKPLPVRLVLYALVGLFTFGTYALCKDVTQVYFEGKIDVELKEKSPVFAEGGKEFYSKLLERNIALRKLLGKEGERAFSVLGNENYFIRHKHIPLVQRKMFFEKAD